MTKDAEEEDVAGYDSFVEEGDHEMEEARRIADGISEVAEELYAMEEEYRSLKRRYVEAQSELEEVMAR